MVSISIIVPCYNVADYINDCMESIVNQTMDSHDFEIILVNDASTDNTLVLLNEWERKYTDNVIVVDCEENHRQGAARNIGMQYASGKYITFIDSDDIVDKTLLEKLYKRAMEYDCDVVECAYADFTDTEGLQPQQFFDDFYWKIDTIERRKEFILYSQKVAVWGRLYKRDFIWQNQLFFLEDVGYEDIHFTGMAMLLAKDFCAIGESLYYYRMNDKGTMWKPNDNAFSWRMYVINSFLNEIYERGLLPNTLDPYGEELEYYLITKGYLDAILTAAQTNRLDGKLLSEYVNDLRKRFPECLKNRYLNQNHHTVWQGVKEMIIK